MEEEALSTSKLEKACRIILVILAWAIFSIYGLLPSFMKIPGYSALIGKHVEDSCFLNYAYETNTYEKLFGRNGNLASGGMVFAQEDIAYMQSQGELHYTDFASHKNAIIIKDMEEGIVYDGRYYLEVREDKIIGTCAGSVREVSYQWRKKALDKNNSVNYTSVYRMIHNTDLSGLACLIGLARENRLLGKSGKCVYYAERNGNNVTVYRQTGQYKKDVAKLVEFQPYGKILYLDEHIYFINAGQSEIKCIDLRCPQSGADTAAVIPREAGKITLINISKSSNGAYYHIQNNYWDTLFNKRVYSRIRWKRTDYSNDTADSHLHRNFFYFG